MEISFSMGKDCFWLKIPIYSIILNKRKKRKQNNCSFIAYSQTQHNIHLKRTNLSAGDRSSIYTARKPTYFRFIDKPAADLGPVITNNLRFASIRDRMIRQHYYITAPTNRTTKGATCTNHARRHALPEQPGLRLLI